MAIGGLLKKGAQKGVQGVKTGAKKVKEAGQAGERMVRRNPGKSGAAAGAAGGIGAAVAAQGPLPEEFWEALEETGRLEELGEYEEDYLRKLQEDDPERFAAIMFEHGHKLGQMPELG